jgi:hypothetical protein
VTRIGSGAELSNEGNKKAADALLGDVFEIKVEVTHQGQSAIAF